MNQTATDNRPQKITVIADCLICGATKQVTGNAQTWQRWRDGQVLRRRLPTARPSHPPLASKRHLPRPQPGEEAMNHSNEIDHDEHAAVQAHIDAEGEAEHQAKTNTERLRAMRLLLQLTSISAHCQTRLDIIHLSGEMDTTDDIDEELIKLEAIAEAIITSANGFFNILASDTPEAPDVPHLVGVAYLDDVLFEVRDVQTVPTGNEAA